MRLTLQDIAKMKPAGRRIAMVTAYDYPSARLVDRAGLPLILVGDSLGMVVHGHETTLPVTLDDMVRHTAAVARGAEQALVIADLPFMTYVTAEQAAASAAALMRAGAQAVKLEGAGEMVGVVKRLVSLGVPVMGHLGFTPQSAHQIGVRVQGKDAGAAARLIEDAVALEAAGCFALVLELVPAALAAEIARRLAIPVIGIGAGAGCDGQVQVWHDLLGLSDRTPRHARRFAEVGAEIERALAAYAAEVQDGTFPTAANSSTIEPAVLEQVLAGAEA